MIVSHVQATSGHGNLPKFVLLTSWALRIFRRKQEWAKVEKIRLKNTTQKENGIRKMIFSVSDKGGLEEKKFCPMYYQAQIRSYISTAVPSQFHK